VLSRRLASAAIIIAVMVVLAGLDFNLGRADQLGRPGLVAVVFAVFIAILSAGEMSKLLETDKVAIPALPAMLVSAVCVLICGIPVFWRDYPTNFPLSLLGWTTLALATAIGITFLREIIAFKTDATGTDRGARTSLIHTHIIILCGFLIAHRLFRFDNALGLIALITLVVTVKMSDIAAYFSGKLFGTIRLAPQLSPGKTVQGAVGSFFGAWLGTFAMAYLMAPFLFSSEIDFPVWWVLVYGVVVTLTGILGDLTVSLFKRDAGSKDSSSWLPGLGGVLDVTDSLVFSAPASYVLWLVLSEIQP
jgi:phosphatidate cytidylyltransferase